MSGNDREKKSEVRPKRTVLSPNTMSTTHYVKTLTSSKQGGQGDGKQSNGDSDKGSSLKSGEKNAGDES